MKPMLAAKADLSKLRYPVLVSPKLDGIRCLIRDGVALSRSLKPIPNNLVQMWASYGAWDGYDGELIVGPPTSPSCYNDTQSGVMSHDGPMPDWYPFDRWDAPDKTYSERCQLMTEGAIVQQWVYNEDELLVFEEDVLLQGFEGVMIRDPNGLYKYGRSTVKEQYLLKLKRVQDSEAEIIGFKEQMHNDNPATQDNLGHTKRSSAQAGMVPAGYLGAFLCRDRYSGVEFAVGTGMSLSQRKRYWHQREELLGQTIKYKFLPVGVKEAPRHPVFLGFRSEIDL